MLQATKPAQQPVSAWQAAGAALETGKDAKARRMLTAALSHPQPMATVPDLSMAPSLANELIDLLGSPLPYGDPGNEFVLANLLLKTGRFDEAAHYAAGSYQRNPNTLSAAVVARAAAALGDDATAIGWLDTAAQSGTSPAGLAATIDRAPELVAIRHHPDVVAIRQTVAPAP